MSVPFTIGRLIDYFSSTNPVSLLLSLPVLLCTVGNGVHLRK